MTTARAARLHRPAFGSIRLRFLAAAVLAASIATVTPGTAQAAATCSTAEGFSRLSSGPLYRMTDNQLLTAPNTLVETRIVGTGWGTFAWTGAGGDGVLYALTTAGKLLWYRYDPTTAAWMSGSGKVIGAGFTPGSRVVNIAVGANGWLYTVRSDGKLVVYQHTGRLTGAATWVNGGGYVIGSGWTGNEILAPQGDGTLYRQIGGKLFWFHHTDPSLGAVTWTNSGRATQIGSGWRFYDLLALGGGVLLATTAPSGQVSLFEHGDPAGGAATWVINTGLKKYLARSDSFGVSVAPNTCS